MKSFLLIVVFISSVSCGFLEEPEEPVEPINTQSTGANKGDVNIQRITKSVHKGNGLFWWEKKDSLIYLETVVPTIYTWNYQSGKINATYPKIDEILVFAIPLKKKDNQAVLASDNHLRIITWNDNGTHSLSKVIKSIPDRGYIFCKGHCDVNGNLYALAHHPENKNASSIMFKITSSAQMKKMYQFEYRARDFAFDAKNNKICFVLSDCGTKIYSYDFDADKGTLSNEKLFVEVYTAPCDIIMTGIDLDQNNNLWVTAEGDPGRLFKIDYNSKQVKNLIMFPHELACQITWGGPKNSNIFVGFDKTDNECDNQSGDTMVVTGLREQGKTDYLYNYE